jgi:hypothetical protein
MALITYLALGFAGACDAPNPLYGIVPRAADAGPSPDGAAASRLVDAAAAETPPAGSAADTATVDGTMVAPDAQRPPLDARPDVSAAPQDAAVQYRGDLSRGLVVYLRLDDGPGTTLVRDASGRGSIANLRSIDTNSAWSEGRFSRALTLAGPTWSGWVEVASNDGLNGLTTQATVAMWIWRTGVGGTLISRRAVGARGFIYEVGLEGDTLFARLNTAAAYNARVTGTAIPLGRWVHVAMTFDTQAVRLYVDGNPVGATPYQQSLPLELSALVVGGAEQQDRTVGGRFPGKIDDVAVYARTLAPADLAAMAAGAQPPSQ